TEIPLEYMIGLSCLVFFIGLAGVLIRRNLITMLMGVELMLNAVNINFVAFNHYLFPDRFEGHFFALIVMAIAAAEAAVAIALIINIYRKFATVSVDDVDELKY
ncbi:MAG TPA: NADH-quinone oxidoreductase subunit NuoK, partial [Chryseosolibacter sp.]